MLKIKERDYVPDGAGSLCRAEGREALLQRVLFRLAARRGQFPFLEDLGSSLWRLGRVSTAARQSAAEQYVAEALTAEKGLTVEVVTLTQEDGMAQVMVELAYQGEALSVTLAVP